MPRRRDPPVPLWYGLGVGVRVMGIPLVVVLAWGGIVLLGFFAYFELTEGEADDERGRFAPPDRMCLPEDIESSAQFGEIGPGDGLFILETRLPNVWCSVPGAFTLELVDGSGAVVPVDFSGSNDRYGIAIGWPPERFPSESASYTGFVWQNWCGPPLVAPLSLKFSSAIGEIGPTRVRRSGDRGESAPTPPCVDRDAPSTLEAPRGLDGYVLLRADPLPCDAASLEVTPDFYNIGPRPSPFDAEHAHGGGFLFNQRGDACVPADLDDATLIDANGNELQVDVRVNNELDDDDFIIGPDWVHVAFEWSNWCGPRLEGPMIITVRFEDERGELTWPIAQEVDGRVSPPCDDPDDESQLLVTLG